MICIDSEPGDSQEAERILKNKPLLLRPHHGMCFQFYKGKGYNEDFTDHMGRIARELADNPMRQISLQIRTDCVCENCPNSEGERCTSQDKVTQYDNAVLQACDLKDGDTLSYTAFVHLVTQNILAKNLRKKICGDCVWNEICETFM